MDMKKLTKNVEERRVKHLASGQDSRIRRMISDLEHAVDFLSQYLGDAENDKNKAYFDKIESTIRALNSAL